MVILFLLLPPKKTVTSTITVNSDKKSILMSALSLMLVCSASCSAAEKSGSLISIALSWPSAPSGNEFSHSRMIKKLVLCDSGSLIRDEYGHLTSASRAQIPAPCFSADKTDPLVLLNTSVCLCVCAVSRWVGKPTERCCIDVLNVAADLHLTSRAYHMAVDRDKSVTAKEVRQVGTTACREVEGRPDGSGSE